LTAIYGGEDIALEGEAAPTVASTFDVSGQLLVGRPSEELSAFTSYSVTWPALLGVESDERGAGATVSFVTGSGPDREPPHLSGIARLKWEVEKNHDACSDDATERYVFDLSLVGATDDQPLELLEVIAFQTRGPGIGPEDPPQVVLSAPLDPDDPTPRVSLARSAALGEVCFSAILLDAAEHVSPATEEACLTTRRPPFFEGCSVRGAVLGPTTWWLQLLLLMLIRQGNPRRTA
jgi:hypothetical protein